MLQYPDAKTMIITKFVITTVPNTTSLVGLLYHYRFDQFSVQK